MNSQHIFSRDGPFSLLGGPHFLQKVRESRYRIPVLNDLPLIDFCMSPAISNPAISN